MKLSTILVLLPQFVRSDDWNINTGSITTTADNVITVSHDDVGDEVDGVMLDLYAGAGCEGSVTQSVSNAYVSLNKPSGEECWTDFKYEINVDKSKAEDMTNPFKDGSKLIFCVKATTLEGESNPLQVNFAKTNFELDFTKNLNDISFTAITYGVVENSAGSVTEDYTVTGTISACVCTETSIGCEADALLNQDDFVYICLTPGNSLIITDFNMVMERAGYTYAPVGAGSVANAVTTITDVGNVKKIRTPVVKGLVEASTDIGVKIIVTGAANLAVDGGRMGSENKFEMEIAVNPNCEGNSIFGALLRMHS